MSYFPSMCQTPAMAFFGGNETLDVARSLDMLQHVG
jgi:hypothetical protein